MAHVPEEAMVSHQQQRTRVLQVILDPPLGSEHRLLDSTVVRIQLTHLCCQTVIEPAAGAAVQPTVVVMRLRILKHDRRPVLWEKIGGIGPHITADRWVLQSSQVPDVFRAVNQQPAIRGR